MTARSLNVAVVMSSLVMTIAAFAQTGHPAKGSWLGYWGPSEDEQNRIRLLLDWKDRQITGVINPGRNAIPIERAELDPDDWTLTIEAEMPVEGGGTEHYVVTGQLKNLGSWTNRVYEGTYHLGAESGNFRVALN